MHMPGFTADVSVYRSTRTYHRTPAGTPAAAPGDITPQAWCGGFTLAGCCRLCASWGYRWCGCSATHCHCWN
ncbi:hypothetical protein [Thermomonospora umbrina]|uniref:Uncharacterized protein n=1 Tax=Thermomonospora umbrina TaxID=111806 RepID=A0A3D9SNP6_9ACTN|nr:hypothetical protein [Thermomonospora umbrina]REE97247.1 hypothetical protein DFJ69_2712 [Thermomonospora umbrina]